MRTLLVCALVAACAGAAVAQLPLPGSALPPIGGNANLPAPNLVPPPLPKMTTSPLLYVRVKMPGGGKVTLFQGRARERTFDAPAVVGLRPGYCYVLRLMGLPGKPETALYPSIEVRGSLALQPRFGAADFPATIELTDTDIDAAVRGTLVTKVVYLEHPDRARPEAIKPGEIHETTLPAGSDLAGEARNRGRLMVVFRLGGREATPEEIARTNVPGTILHPGDKTIGRAVAPPCIQGLGPKFWDPRLGPRPFEEECLHDGGDRGAPVGFDAEGKLGGLDPEDTVAEYVDAKGRRQIAKSNRVCLTVPRFAALRMETPLSNTEGVFAPANKTQIKRNETILEKLGGREAAQVKIPRTDVGRTRPMVNVGVKTPGEITQIVFLTARQLDMGPAEYVGTKFLQKLSPAQKVVILEQLKTVKMFTAITNLAGFENIKGTSVVARVEPGPNVISGSREVIDLTVCCNETPAPPDKPLVLFKCADKQSAQPGDIVTFTLRFSNVGGRPMTDVAVSDSLSPRLEYVPGSAESDRDAVFTVQPNEAGSSILRWEVTGKLLPGQSGRVRFQAKVR